MASQLLFHWQTALTRQFACRVPIMGAPMAGVSGGKLAAATCRAGGLGFIAAGHLQSLDPLERQIEIFHQEVARYKEEEEDDNNDDVNSTTDNNNNNNKYPLCIGFIGYSTLADEHGWRRYETVLRKHRPAVVQFFAPSIQSYNSSAGSSGGGDDATISNVDLAHQHDAKVIAQVGNVEEALRALDAGVDGIVAQGSEAGGHGLRPEVGNGTLALAARLVQIVAAQSSVVDTPGENGTTSPRSRIPVLAAGGISSAPTVAAALAMGCDGVVLGTRLWCSDESIGNPSFQRAMVNESRRSSNGGTTTTCCDHVVRSTAHDAIQNTYSTTPWPFPYDSVGALKNQTTDHWTAAREGELQSKLEKIREGGGDDGDDGGNANLVRQYRQAQGEGNGDIAAVLCGEGVGEITSIEPAFDIIRRINEETIGIISHLSNKLLKEA